MKIVGVVGDVRQYGPAAKPSPEIIMPYEQHPEPSTALNVVVRAAGPAVHCGGRFSGWCARVRRRFR